ncbi:uncharacterized protein LOC126809693 [Patella vulgata]|uniref:uncharacterized protein LOC126809693 n=1 Tax=Patella vulgata TaxID=6465 RepID=UPI0024A923D1|nr:uncharacterized protein LOC126809693 [Patella vulgata]
MEEERYVANIIEFTGGFTVHVDEDAIKPQKRTKKSIQKFGYVLGATIGTGSYSKIKICHSKKLNDKVAVKIVHKKRLPPEYIDKFVPREIAILQKLEHPGVMQLIEVFETENTMYLVMEYMSRGDLLDYVNSVGNLHEADARRLFRQLVDVVAYLHGNQIYHRDIKLDNILLDQNYNIRLSDFGFSRFNPQREELQTFCGSYSYAAPEILDGEKYNGAKIDIWSMGVCLYGMLNGKLPFRDTDVDVLREGMKEKIKFYKFVSRAYIILYVLLFLHFSDGRDLVRAILEPNVKKRYSIKDITHSNWMCRPIKTGGTMSMSSLAVAAVTSETSNQASLDLNAEHGFSCAQNTKEQKPNKVSGVLRSVAINHSTGASSVNLENVKMPLKKASSIEMTTGVSGPAGRRISVQLGIMPDVAPEVVKAESTLTPALAPIAEKPSRGLVSKWGAAMGGEETNKSGNGKANFKKALKALTKFKCVVQVVTATKRFKRGPLTTILTIPQEKAMERMIEKRHSLQLQDFKHLAHTDGAKVANLCSADVRKESLLKKKSSQFMEESERLRQEKVEKMENTFNILGSSV